MPYGAGIVLRHDYGGQGDMDEKPDATEETLRKFCAVTYTAILVTKRSWKLFGCQGQNEGGGVKMAELLVVGKSVPRVDSVEKATGKAVFCSDIKLPACFTLKFWSPYPHAKILSIDTSKAEQVAGVVRVLTGKDAPEKKYGAVIYDESVLPKRVVRAIDAPVAAVAAETVEAAEEAVALIEVQYEPLAAIFDPEQSVRTDPPVIIHPDLAKYEVGVLLYYRLDKERPNVFSHFKVRHGDFDKGFQEADLVLENRFSTAKIQRCAIERHAVIARPKRTAD